MNLKKQIRHCIMHAMPLNGFHKERYQEVIMVILEAYCTKEEKIKTLPSIISIKI